MPESPESKTTEDPTSEDVAARDVSAPDNARPPGIDVNLSHAAHSHAHDRILKGTVLNFGVTLTGNLLTCDGWER